MNTAACISVMLYMQTQVVTGLIRNAHEQRLLDLLNGLFVRDELKSSLRSRFLELSEVTIYGADGKGEILATASINKGLIQLVTTPDVELSKGRGSREGHKSYSYQHKIPVPVRLTTPAYEISGNMYRSANQMTQYVLEDESMFLPVTDAEIRILRNHEFAKVAFVAVNKEQILFLKPAPLDQGSSESLIVSMRQENSVS